ncbi:Sister chromatid cohesion 1 protein 1 [Morella rubra]|uniref:Sister chromatid cohesion 1 protein 1 n=1 Tax=Morella rubra TaxID=262757 RepID=A0A6A1VY52_9ROSI|nr:Sister chromatid cohesion 1 protein 1 [Morella rubra]
MGQGKEAVTLPENEETDMGDIEQSLNFPHTVTFQHTAYFAMRLDSVDEPYINDNAEEGSPCKNLHQADAENITLFDHFDSYQANADLYNRFERFDIEGDDDTQLNFTSGEQTQMPTTLIPSPRLQDDPQTDYTSLIIQESLVKQDQQRPGPMKRKTRRPTACVMDFEQTMIPGHLYQSWLQNASDIVSRRGRKRKPFEEFHSGVGSKSLGISIEKQRTYVVNNDIPTEILMEELRANLTNNGGMIAEATMMVTPGNSVDRARSIPSSASGPGVLSNSSEVNSGRSNRKRPSSIHSSGGLEPVAEENPWKHSDPNFKLARLSENGLTPDQELFVETGPTQTQHENINPPVDKITDSIRMQMKAHFDTPGAPQAESLNTLALGMNRKGAALLFYQTCGILPPMLLSLPAVVLHW